MASQGFPKGVGVPYWPSDYVGDGHDPDPLSCSDLPSPLVPLADFLGGAGQTGLLQKSQGEGEGDDANMMTIEFEPTPFDHPVFIMFSSGTTGLPKCMVHGAGGTLVIVYFCI